MSVLVSQGPATGAEDDGLGFHIVEVVGSQIFKRIKKAIVCPKTGPIEELRTLRGLVVLEQFKTFEFTDCGDHGVPGDTGSVVAAMFCIVSVGARIVGPDVGAKVRSACGIGDGGYGGGHDIRRALGEAQTIQDLCAVVECQIPIGRALVQQAPGAIAEAGRIGVVICGPQFFDAIKVHGTTRTLKVPWRSGLK